MDWAVGDLLKLSVGMSPLDVVLQAIRVVTVKIKSSIRNILGYPQSAENEPLWGLISFDPESSLLRDNPEWNADVILKLLRIFCLIGLLRLLQARKSVINFRIDSGTKCYTRLDAVWWCDQRLAVKD